MSFDLTEEQRQALLNGEAVSCSSHDLGASLVLLRQDRYQALLQDVEDRKLQEAFLRSSHQAAVAWMKENPY